MARRRIGDLLVDAGVITPEQLQQVLARQVIEGETRIASEVLRLGLAHERQLAEALASSAGHPSVVISESTLDLSLLSVVPQHVAQQHELLPIGVEGQSVVVAVADADSRPIFEQVSFATGRPVTLVLTVEDLLTAAIPEAYAAAARGEQLLPGARSSFDQAQLTIVRHEVDEDVEASRRFIESLMGAQAPGAGASPAPAEAVAATPVSQFAGGLPLEEPPAVAGIPIDEPPAVTGTVIEEPAPVAAPPKPNKPPPGAVAVGPTPTKKALPLRPGDGKGDGKAVAKIALKRLAVPVMPAPSGAPPITLIGGDGKPMILIVEDDPDILRLLSKSLEHDGYHVMEATSGDAAVALLRGGKPQLVITDAMLPGMHGFEICQRLKSAEQYKDVPIIMISAVYRGWEHAREIQEVHGADAFIEKPFDIHYVRKLVAEMLGRPLERAPRPQDREQTIAALRHELDEHRLMGDWQPALQCVTRWLELDPFDPIAHLEAGNLLSQQKDLEGAMRAYESSVVYDKSCFPALSNLALVYERLGFGRKGAETWRKALEHAPDDAAKTRIQARLAQHA
jgi:DNA-binding response OmpR family regulator